MSVPVRPGNFQKGGRFIMYLDPCYCSFDAVRQRLDVTLPWNNIRYRIGAWAKGCSAEVLREGRWRPVIGDLDIPLVTDLLTAGEKFHPIARYASTVPAFVRAPLADCEQGQLALLQVCAASQRGIQLLHSAPLLLWFVAPHLLAHARGEPERIHRLLGFKQRDLLSLACGRNETSLLHLLARIPLPNRVEDPHALLTHILTSEAAVALLRHTKSCNCNWNYLILLRQAKGLLHLPLPRSILLSDMPTGSMRTTLVESRRVVDDTRRMGVQLGIGAVDAILEDCRNWDQVMRIHDAWVRRLAEADLDRQVSALGNDLPPPPLPGTESIVPVDTVRELLVEGKIMHHCVGGYVSKVRAGACYIYRMTEPERVTIELRQDGKGRWLPAQVKSYCNRQPAKAAYMALEKWLLKSS